MSSSKIYSTSHHSASDLVEHMYHYLIDAQGMETQRIHNAESNFSIVQARTKGGKVKQFVGLDKAVTLRFIASPGVVNVEIGEAKWVDKSVVMTISMFILWPLAATSGVGFYKQQKLLNDLNAEMDTYMVNAPDRNAEEKDSCSSKAFEDRIEEINRSPTMQRIVGHADKIIRMLTR